MEEQIKKQQQIFEEKPIMEKMNVILSQIEELKKLLSDLPSIAEQVEKIAEATIPPLPTDLK